ncbi:MAG: AEC family transporter [Hyphomicrobiales bacterium]
MTNIISLAIPLFALIFLGLLAGKIVPEDRRGLVWINIFVVYLAIPSLIFKLISKAPLEELVNWRYVAGTTLSTYLIFMLMLITAVLIGRASLRVASMQASAAAYGNVGYMGVPLAVAVFGDMAAAPATLILSFDTALFFMLVPLLQAADRPSASLGDALREGAKSIAFNPLILALVAGALAAATSLRLPAPVDATIGYLAAGAAPAALFAIGVTIARQPPGSVNWEIPVISLCKLVVHPMLVLGVMMVMGGFEPMWVEVAVLLAALPTAANVYVLATKFDVYTEGASSSILITTLAAVGTLSVLLLLISLGVTRSNPFAWLG